MGFRSFNDPLVVYVCGINNTWCFDAFDLREYTFSYFLPLLTYHLLTLNFTINNIKTWLEMVPVWLQCIISMNTQSWIEKIVLYLFPWPGRDSNLRTLNWQVLWYPMDHWNSTRIHYLKWLFLFECKKIIITISSQIENSALTTRQEDRRTRERERERERERDRDRERQKERDKQMK